jgi:type IV pilus assembly protein PilY1
MLFSGVSAGREAAVWWKRGTEDVFEWFFPECGGKAAPTLKSLYFYGQGSMEKIVKKIGWLTIGSRRCTVVSGICFVSAVLLGIVTVVAIMVRSAAGTTTPPGLCLDICSIPLDTQLQAAPANVMFVIDDSGSMDWEFMTEESDGVFSDKYFNFNMSDNAYSNYYYALYGSNRKKWKARWHGYNRMYYNPGVDYSPWPLYGNASTASPRSDPTSESPTLSLSAEYDSIAAGVIVDNDDAGFSKSNDGWAVYTASAQYGDDYYYSYHNGGLAWARWTPEIPGPGSYDVFGWWVTNSTRRTDASFKVFHNGILSTVAGVNQQQNGGQWNLLDTYYFSGSGDEYIQLDATVSGDSRYCADAIKLSPASAGEISVKNAHYYVYSHTENIPYLVVLDGEIKYYRFSRDVPDVTDAGLIPDSSPPDDVIPKNEDGSGRSYIEELQNFANWFSYYRRREFTSKAAIARVISDMQGVNVGFLSINLRLIQPVLPVNVTREGSTSDSTNTLLTLLYALDSNGGTPLRAGLKRVGQYFHQDDGATGGIGTSPYASDADGGACQQCFAIVMTDGYWNGSLSGVGNEDGNQNEPYSDGFSATLADVAMKYYKNDLSTSLQDLVPTTPPDFATHQHMVTYGVSFGVSGTLDPDDYDLYNADPSLRIYPDWPNPHYNPQERKIDDLWHASVNGRGKFLSASNPENLLDSLKAVMQNIMARVGSGASVSINGEKLHTGTAMYQAQYSTDGWSGDVKAYAIDQESGFVLQDVPLWSAAGLLDVRDWNTGRLIATYDGSEGVPFRFSELADSQKDCLDPDWASDETIAVERLEYLRGNKTKEVANGGYFRNRFSLLGDIVHSSPVYHEGVLYVGGNDGMLHVLDVATGEELFAYVPNLVFHNLLELTSPSYDHHYFVDLSPAVRDIGAGTYLTGGLGLGGSGYYCLDVSEPFVMYSEEALAGKVMWEYPRLSTPEAERLDLGYTYSMPSIVDSNEGWVVIFGNGYSSPNENALLFVLDLATGVCIARIDTGVGGCNGLSTPIAVDVNNDGKVDYVYAGDLKGNLWKFDLTDSEASSWETAYSDGINPKPLFQAKDENGISQPITTRPDVMYHCLTSAPGYIVIFGTGKYLGNSDFIDSSTQTIYGIWDYGDDGDNSEYLGSFERGTANELSNQPQTVTLLNQAEVYYGIEDGRYLRVLSDHEPNWVMDQDEDTEEKPNPSASVDNHAGWFFDLPLSKERIVRDLMIRDGKAIVISNIPKSSPCAAGGDSIVHEMNACTGGRMNIPQFDINGDAVIDEQDMMEIADTENPGETIHVAPTGIDYPSMIYTPQVLRMPDKTEMKYFSSAAANIVTLRERGEKRGLYYWRHLD